MIIAKDYIKLKVLKAECYAHLHQFNSSQEVVTDILYADKKNPDAIYVRGLCYYLQDKPDKAIPHFENVLRLIPNHTKTLSILKVLNLL